mmetsp:Transcript_151207/g.262009  ORF Transcript_151207/g.262009 Transcript_151207/m.262009 type:complete len:450 (-) Transcript_151207:98-1447(-)
MLLPLALLGLSILATAESVAPPCNLSRSFDEVCADFCDYKCGFYNVSAGDNGRIKRRTIYRLTPPNVTGIQNKDTGDAPGDISFWLSKKNLTQQCAIDPTGFGCFLDGRNLYGAFVVEMDTQFGPYQECNPVNVFDKDPWEPLWIDTRTFDCGQNCLWPIPKSGCKNPWTKPGKNGTYGFNGAWQCFCDGTHRHERTVGVELMPFAAQKNPGPSSWPAQCFLSFYAPNETSQNCVQGNVYKEVKGWSFSSTASLACEACSKDDNCEGWATIDNQTAHLFQGSLHQYYHVGCVAGFKFHMPYGMTSWGSAGNVGGFWYSTPMTAECAPGEAVGTNGCTWRVLSAVYKNASCIDGLVDSAVEEHGKVCFDMCSQPLNRTSTCYLYCYRDSLLGHPGLNLSKMENKQIIDPWEHGFNEIDPSKGGCPILQPAPCQGSQCGQPHVHNLDSLVV